MNTIDNSTSNGKITKTKKTYRNLDEISLQKNYLRIIKYTLDYSNNSRSSTSFLKTREKKDTYIGPIYISLFKNFIMNKQNLLILRKELITK